MKIAVNTRMLLKGRLEGIGWYTYETLRRITVAHPEHEFYFLFDRAYDPSFIFGDNVHPVVLFPPARHPLLWYWWFERSVPNALYKLDADLFLSLDGYASLKTTVPTVLVIHDLAFEHYPSHVPATARWYYKHFTPLYAHKAKQIVTVSHYSARDIAQQYQVPTSRISVTPNGVNERYAAVSPEQIEQAKQRFTQGADYFVYAGNINPRKNISRMMLAFAQFKAVTQAPVKLVIAGALGWNYRDILRTLDNLPCKQDVVMTGHLPADDLSALLAGSLGMVYVSLFEGFGIPVVEAMQAGVPVITSNVSSMPEVAGDAALLVDPTSTDQIAQAMQQLYQQPDLRQQLIQRGHAQAQQFTWDSTADLLWQVIERVLPA